MEALEEGQYQKGTRYLQDVQEQYRKAINETVQDIEHWYRRLADNNGISLAAARKLLKKDELNEFHWSVEQYIKAGRENAVNQRWMKELENASAKYHISYLQAMKLQMQQHAELLAAEFEGGMTEFLHKSYGDQYYRTAFEIAKGTGVGSNLTQLDKRKVEALLKKPWAQDGKNFSDRIWDNKEKLVRELHRELAQNIIRGESPDKAIERLAKTMNVSRNQAGTLVLTELSAISSEAQRECFKELGVREFLVVETLDGITCETCQAMDRKHFPLSDFAVGETAPPFHPRCRGCVSPYYDDEFSQTGERAARDPETGKTCYVPANMAYPEWKEKYVKKPHQEENGQGKPAADYLVRSHVPGQDIAGERKIVEGTISAMPRKVRDALEQGTIVDIGKEGASQYDYTHDILYIAKGANRTAVIHEIGHMVESKLLESGAVEGLRKKAVKGITIFDLDKDIFLDAADNEIEIFFVKNDMFVSDYQGRTYVEDIFDAFEPDGTFKDDLLWEYISEAFREYIENPEGLKARDAELYGLIAGAVE